jgi:hypothetical protein
MGGFHEDGDLVQTSIRIKSLGARLQSRHLIVHVEYSLRWTPIFEFLFGHIVFENELGLEDRPKSLFYVYVPSFGMKIAV